MDITQLQGTVDRLWDGSILPVIQEYIRIPNESPDFDSEWEAHGYMEQAVKLVSGWCEEQEIEGMSIEVLRLPGRTPLIVAEIPGEGDQTVLLYGHLDKQPAMVGWKEGRGPWTPVMEGDRLYGRGGADDGYAAFASLAALQGLQEQGVPRSRCVMLIEASEESGSPDLPAYLEILKDRLGEPDLVICLDSGCGNYEQLWSTTSLRGMVLGTLRVSVLSEGVHSGDAGGLVPDSFRVLRHLLTRIEDPETGRLLLDELHSEIPENRKEEAGRSGEVLAEVLGSRFPWVEGSIAESLDPVEAVLDRTWRPALAITGQEGLPAISSAGNVLRPETAVKISLRIPPQCDPEGATAAVRRALESDPPAGTRVTFESDAPCAGWEAPATVPWLAEAMDQASQEVFGKPSCSMGEGGTIPFMAMLGEAYPKAQFLITGVLGPKANAHGPNEFLHVPYAKKLTACVAQVIASHHRSV